MRSDQLEKLETLQEKLADVIIMEADPDNWPGANKAPKEMDREERGDRYWCKKNAAATITLLSKTLSLAYFRDRLKPENPPNQNEDDEGDLDKEIAAAEKQAGKLLEEFQKRKKFTVVK